MALGPITYKHKGEAYSEYLNVAMMFRNDKYDDQSSFFFFPQVESLLISLQVADPFNMPTIKEQGMKLWRYKIKPHSETSAQSFCAST